MDIPTLDNSVVSVLAFEWSNRKAFPTIDHMIVTGFHGRGRDHLSAVQAGGGGQVRGQHCAVEIKLQQKIALRKEIWPIKLRYDLFRNLKLEL